MGRRRIFIAKITQEKRRRNTFGKRKKGLLKKAMELSILCDCEVAVVVIAKSETYAYASNGLPLETVQRALNNQPDVLNNSMYDNLYNGEDDSLSGDEDLYSSSTDLAPSVPPIIPTGGGILVEKVPRTKRKRESMPQEEIPERPAPLHPAINESTEVHTYQRFSPTDASPGTQISANQQTDMNQILQHMTALTQLLQNNSAFTNSNAGTMFLGSIKEKMDNISNSSLASTFNSVLPNSATSNSGQTAHETGIDSPSLLTSISPLMPLNDLSPHLTLSPQFPFASISSPSQLPSTSPIEIPITESELSPNSNLRDFSSFSELASRKGISLMSTIPDHVAKKLQASTQDKHTTTSIVSSPSLQLSSSALKPLTNSVNNTASNTGLGLRISVPQPPLVMNIPSHLMSATSVPVNGPIGNNSAEASKKQESDKHGAKTPSENVIDQQVNSTESSPQQTTPISSGTVNRNSFNNVSFGSNGSLNSNSISPLNDSILMPPPLSSLQVPSNPFANTNTIQNNTNNDINQHWLSLSSPLTAPSSNGLYSPYLYSPRN